MQADTPKQPRHRHERSSWLMTSGNGYIEWCYQCGAQRRLHWEGGALRARKNWLKPTGIGGPNPTMKGNT